MQTKRLLVLSLWWCESKMERAVHRQPAELSMDYVNVPDSSGRMRPNKDNKENHAAPGRKLFRLIGISFGLLCVLQAALNVSLRLTHFKFGSIRPPSICKNVSEEQRQLFEQYMQHGWLYFHTSLYYISFNTSTWYDSREFCQRQAADLVIINTKAEQDFIGQFYRLTWIGLRNLTKTRKWTWVDGTPLTKSYWGTGEPNGFEGKNENCVETRFFGEENNWNDIPCGDQNFWICEKEVAL